MSRTTLAILTAVVLATTGLVVMAARRHVMGREGKPLAGPGTWKVTLLVHGKSTGDSRLMTVTPPSFGKQNILRESCRSEELVNHPPDARHPARRQVIWTLRPSAKNAPIQARYDFFCSTGVARPTSRMTEAAKNLCAPPHPGQYLQSEPGIESDHASIAALARRLGSGLDRREDQAEVLFRYVDHEISSEPTVAGRAASALDCLQYESGDSAAKSRLLTALCRNRGIPARLVTGLALVPGSEQTALTWVEAWLNEHWLPMCPLHHHYGRVPRSYLTLGFGDLPIVRGRHVNDLSFGFLVERVGPDGPADAPPPSLLRTLFRTFSFHDLQPPEQRLVEFLLLLPVAALIVCLFRNVVGIQSFGTFAPALLGLAFRELASLPGILIFVGVVLIGWMIRRSLDRYHLLQVPRMAVLLTLVVIVLMTGIVAANYHGLAATRYIALFPMVILTGMIERFWTVEAEDGTMASFRTLLSTLLVACSISLCLSIPVIVRHLYHYPETLGVIMACQLLIGRYTGYRLLELYRFRELTHTLQIAD